jgi:hypothetical protein
MLKITRHFGKRSYYLEGKYVMVVFSGGFYIGWTVGSELALTVLGDWWSGRVAGFYGGAGV